MDQTAIEQLEEASQGGIHEQTVVSQLQNLKPVSARQQLLTQENEDLLFLRSLLPYMTGLPLVQRLSLRAEINTAVIKAWEKRAKAGLADLEGNGEQKGS